MKTSSKQNPVEVPAPRSPMTEQIPIRRALISVSDKTGLIPFAQRLADQGVSIISTGGTARAIADAGIDVTPVEQITGFPEMMDGRVKTLHPMVHGALLALRDTPDHAKAMADHGIQPIDLVCVNLYPFQRTVDALDAAGQDNPTTGLSPEAIEQIDIGGPSMIRSAAKNHQYVAVVTDPTQYDLVADQIDEHDGCTTHALRTRLAAAAFTKTAAYDQAIAAWMNRPNKHDQTEQADPRFPETLTLKINRLATLRYGENPHQAAALYTAPTNTTEASVAAAKQLHGKELSFNNLNDAAAALELVKEFSTPAAAVIKHTNPCGCGLASTAQQAFERAYAGDPLAAFGGVVAFNRPVDAETAQAMAAPGTDGTTKFLEVILAPGYDPDALNTLKERWKNVRLLDVGQLPDPDQRDQNQLDLKTLVGGTLLQERDLAPMSPKNWTHAAGPALHQTDDALLQDLFLAWCAVKHVKSNAITLAHQGTLVGAGAGQMDRVESCKIAVAKANTRGQNRSNNAAAASDAFFPFPDGPQVLIDAGVRAIVQPGGSKRDGQTIALCNQTDTSLFFTGRRHFRH